jgi:hypothetical protein
MENTEEKWVVVVGDAKFVRNVIIDINNVTKMARKEQITSKRASS